MIWRPGWLCVRKSLLSIPETAHRIFASTTSPCWLRQPTRRGRSKSASKCLRISSNASRRRTDSENVGVNALACNLKSGVRKVSNQLSANQTCLDTSLTLRAVRWGDLQVVAQLIYDTCEAEGDTSVAVTPDDLANEWKYQGFNPEQDACLVEAREPACGRLCGAFRCQRPLRPER